MNPNTRYKIEKIIRFLRPDYISCPKCQKRVRNIKKKYDGKLMETSEAMTIHTHGVCIDCWYMERERTRRGQGNQNHKLFTS